MQEVSSPTPFMQKKRIVVLWVFTVAFLAVIAVSQPWLDEQSGLDIALDILGSFLVIAGVFGRLWSILYIGGNKNNQLVTAGPFSVTRNPLYFSSIMAISGIGLMFGSLAIAIILTLCASCIFFYTAAREAAYLRQLFGSEYSSYARVTPLFWPKLSLMHSPNEIPVNVSTLTSTFRDALFFFLVLPLMELFEHLRIQEAMPTLFVFP
jgi:protein-S-isoprenylcysteine O-methyltransferase Ste14